MEQIRVTWAGEREAHVFDPNVSPTALYNAILEAGVKGVAEITPGSRTVQIRVDDGADPESILTYVRSIAQRCSDEPSNHATRELEIPICSDADLAPDLEAVARNAGLSPEAAANLHASGRYTVRFLGFAPGFPYINGLPEPLRTPRLDTPRTRVRAGSVGIAGDRTGIYPHPSPGGWRLIGATPLRLFNPARNPPALLAPGDRVRFRRINRTEFDALEADDA